MLELEQELRENREREEEMEKRNKLIYLKESILSSNFKVNLVRAKKINLIKNIVVRGH